MPNKPLVLALTLCAFAGFEPAAAQNLLANSSFNNNITGWTKNLLSPHLLSWDSRDERGSALSGSLRVHNIQPGSSAQGSSPCFAVNPGDTLAFGASIAADGGTTDTRVGLRTYQTPDCTGGGGLLTNATLVTELPITGWGATQGTQVVPAGAISATLLVDVLANGTTPSSVYFDNVFVNRNETCASTDTVACLNNNRFRLSAVWEKPDGSRGWARVIEVTNDSAFLWFFHPANIEGVVKVLDACGFSPNFWVFAAGLTNVKVDVEIFDTLTGETWSHHNPQGQAFAPVQDTGAFATCEP